MITGWPPLIPSEEGETPTFDAGFGWQPSGWYFFTNRFYDSGNGMESHWFASVYRLESLAADPTAPLTVDLAVHIDADNHFVATATATGDTIWRNPHTGTYTSVITIGAGQQGYLPGLAADGIDNVFTVQFNIGVDKPNDPFEGTTVGDIGLYDLRAGKSPTENAPWDMTNPGNKWYGFEKKCPDFSHFGTAGWEEVYHNAEGSSAATTAANGFYIYIYVPRKNINSPPPCVVPLDDLGFPAGYAFLMHRNTWISFVDFRLLNLCGAQVSLSHSQIGDWFFVQNVPSSIGPYAVAYDVRLRQNSDSTPTGFDCRFGSQVGVLTIETDVGGSFDLDFVLSCNDRDADQPRFSKQLGGRYNYPQETEISYSNWLTAQCGVTGLVARHRLDWYAQTYHTGLYYPATQQFHTGYESTRPKAHPQELGPTGLETHTLLVEMLDDFSAQCRDTGLPPVGSWYP